MDGEGRKKKNPQKTPTKQQQKGPKQQLSAGAVRAAIPEQFHPWGCRAGKLLCMHKAPLMCSGFLMVMPAARSGGNNLLILCRFLTGVKIMEH